METNMSIDQTTQLQSKWEELKVLIETLESDIRKNISGNKSAGVRARKGLRLLKTNASEIVKTSLACDKERQ
jgi:hypothetical protein